MKNIKKSLHSVFCALLAAAALAASLPAYAVSQAEIDDLQKKLDALEQQAQEQQDVINDLTSQKASSPASSRSITKSRSTAR